MPNYTQRQIDGISVAATKIVADEFEEFNTPNPPDITPGMARAVLKAVEIEAALISKEPCENCPEWEVLKHDKDPWLIHCPTCGRALTEKSS